MIIQHGHKSLRVPVERDGPLSGSVGLIKCRQTVNRSSPSSRTLASDKKDSEDNAFSMAYILRRFSECKNERGAGGR